MLQGQDCLQLPWALQNVMSKALKASQDPKGVTKFYKVLQSFTKFYKVLEPEFTKFYKVLQGFTKF